jgi:hypothetical protein
MVGVFNPRPDPNGRHMFRRPFSAVNGTFGLPSTMSSTSCNSTDPEVIWYSKPSTAYGGIEGIPELQDNAPPRTAVSISIDDFDCR